MRQFVWIAVMLGCGGSSNKPAPEAPPPATSSLLDCAIVAEHVATIVDAEKPRTTHAAVKDMVSVRCRTDGWTDETRRCLYAIKTVADGRACASTMTDEQQAAIKAHARTLRNQATGTEVPDDASADWVQHVVE